MKRILSVALLYPLFAMLSSAQDSKRITVAAGGGFSFLVGDVKTHTQTGFNFFASGGPRFNSHFTLTLDFNLHHAELKNSFIDPANNISVSGGSLLRVWSLTVNPGYNFIRQERFSAYASGGYGLYNRKLLLAAPGLAPVTICDEFWNVCVDNVSVPTVTGNASLYKGGFNAGGGVNFGTRRKFFIDARYHRMLTTDFATEMVPLTFGVRW